MPAFKYLSNAAGVTTEIQAKDASAGAGDAGKAVALNASGLIDPTMLPGADVDIIEASENLAAGDLVNVHDSTGPKVRKADAAGGMAKRADGYVLASVTSGLSSHSHSWPNRSRAMTSVLASVTSPPARTITAGSNQASGMSPSSPEVTWSLAVAPRRSAALSKAWRNTGTRSAARALTMQAVLRVLHTLRSRE